MKKIRYKSKGFTLIELLITLAIMGIVIQLIYSLFFVGNKSFNISKNKGFAQQNARIASTFIIDELRTVEKISEEELSGKYYSLSFEDGKLFRKTYNDAGIEQEISISNNLSVLNFNYDKDEKLGVLNVIIEANEGEIEANKQSYSLDVDILLENESAYEGIDKFRKLYTIYYSKYD